MFNLSARAMTVNTYAIGNNVSCSPLPTIGGYDCEFVETPPKAWKCPVCLLTLRDPHLLSCCGVKICHSCVSRIVNVKDPCPICRAEHFINLLEKQLQRSILDMKVKCSLGCTWTGELRHLESHISPLDDGDCPLATITCKYGCGQVVKRVDMTDHEECYQNMCANLPTEVKLAKLQASIEKYSIEISNKYEEIHTLEIELDEQRKEVDKLNQQMQRQMAKQEEQNISQDKKAEELEMEELIPKNNKKVTNQDDHETTIDIFGIVEGDPSEITPQPSDSSTNVTLNNLNSDVLLLMSKFKSAPSAGLKYYLEQRKVEIMAADPEQLKQMVNSFQESYQQIIQDPQFKSEKLELPPTTNAECTTRLVDQFNKKYYQCYLSYDATTHSVKIVALSSCEYDLAIKLFKQETNTAKGIVGEPCLSTTTATINSLPSHGLATHKSPMCDVPLQLKGNQLYGTMKHRIMCYPRLPGYLNCNTILITYDFPHGIQGGNHPKPGKPYSGTTRTAYLPHNTEGRHVLKLLRKAFDAGLVFTIVESFSSWKVTWNDEIEHKENTHGGRTACGYPDETYLKRVKENLKAMGVTTN